MVRWKNQDPIDLIGYGIVPIKIDDIVNCKDDEIRFVIQGVARNYNTYFYDIPIPTDPMVNTLILQELQSLTFQPVQDHKALITL